MIKQIKENLESVILDKTNHKTIVAFLLCILTIGLFSSTYLQKEELRNQLSDIQTKYETLQINNADLIEKYNKLKSDYEQLSSDNKKLKSQLEEYQDQQATIDELNGKLTELQKQNDTLKAENESLKAQIAEKEAALQASSRQSSSSGGNGMPVPESTYNGSGDMVWLSETGSKYHSIPDCGRMNPNKARQVSRSSAEARGYDACSKCF